MDCSLPEDDWLPFVGADEINVKFAVESIKWWGGIDAYERFVRRYFHGRKKLCERTLTFKDLKGLLPSTTYRQMNSWESAGLIAPMRDTAGSGWRRYTIVDIASIWLISELRRLGESMKDIKLHLDGVRTNRLKEFLYLAHIIDDYPDTDIKELPKRPPTLTDIEAHILISPAIRVGAILMTGHRLMLAPCDVIIACMGDLMKGRLSFSYIPFSEHIAAAYEKMGYNRCEIGHDLTGHLEGEHLALYHLIQSNETESLQITKKSGGRLNVRRLRRVMGKFNDEEVLDAISSNDNCKVEIVKKDGRTVTIVAEDRWQLKQ